MYVYKSTAESRVTNTAYRVISLGEEFYAGALLEAFDGDEVRKFTEA